MRLLAGEHNGRPGPFKTVQPVQMFDLELPPDEEYRHPLPELLDNCLVYVYRGAAVVAGELVPSHHVAHLNATDLNARDIIFRANSDGMGAMVFAGKRIGEPIAWHGPFVATSQAELRKVFNDYRSGKFPSKRVSWDYRRASA